MFPPKSLHTSSLPDTPQPTHLLSELCHWAEEFLYPDAPPTGVLSRGFFDIGWDMALPRSPQPLSHELQAPGSFVRSSEVYPVQQTPLSTMLDSSAGLVNVIKSF